MHASYLAAIQRFEGFTPVAQPDYAQLSNGYGTRARYAGEQITREEAEKRFQEEIASARAIVERHAPHVDEGTKAALTSLTFNAGDKWTRSGLGEAIRSNDLVTARDLFLQYNKAGGETLSGLVKRRVEEANWIGGGALPVGGATDQQAVPDAWQVATAAASGDLPNEVMAEPSSRAVAAASFPDTAGDAATLILGSNDHGTRATQALPDGPIATPHWVHLATILKLDLLHQQRQSSDSKST